MSETTEDTASTVRFELIIGDDDGTISSGDVKVRWCATPALVQEMEQLGFVDPHVLISTITEHGIEMNRKLVPLAELMTFARFHRSGKNSAIHAWIVNGKQGRKKLKDDFLTKFGGEYTTTLFNDAEPISQYNQSSLYKHAAYVLDIPEGVFGKEPPAWLKWYVNLWHSKKKVEDQCAFRQRMWLAIPKTIPVLLFAALAMFWRSVFVVVFAAAGFRKRINMKYFFDLRNDISGRMMIMSSRYEKDRLSQDYVIERKRPKGKSQYMFFLTPFTPLISVTLFVLFILFGYGTNRYGYAAIDTLFALFTLSGVALLFDGVSAAIYWAHNSSHFAEFFEKVDKLTHRADTYMAERNYWPLWATAGTFGVLGIAYGFTVIPFTIMISVVFVLASIGISHALLLYMERSDIGHNDYTEIRELLCPKDENNLKADYGAVINDKQSVKTRVHLRYQQFKNSVCKPMQM